MANRHDAAPESGAKKRNSTPRAVRSIIILLLLSAVLLVLWTYRSSLSPDQIRLWVQENLLGYSDGNGYPVALENGSISKGNFQVENGAPAMVSDTAFQYLSAGGKTLSLRQHGYSNPVLKRAGNNFLIYDLGNKSFRVSTDGVNFTEAAKYNYVIYTGAIAANGNYAIASASSGYTSQLSVFDKHGEKLMEWASQKYIISAVCFSPSGKRIAASAFTSNGGDVQTTVLVFDLGFEDPVATVSLEDCIVLEAAFSGNDRLMLIGDTCAAAFTVGSPALSVYDYQGQTLGAYDLQPDQGAALALSASADGRNGTLIYLTPDCLGTSVIRFSHILSSIQLCEGGILTLYDGKLSLYDFAGNTVFYEETGHDTQYARYSNGFCYILATSEIRSIPLSFPENSASSQ